MYTIYCAANKINNKIYIGLTIGSISRRATVHKSDALTKRYNLPFHNAIRKYGFDSFEWKMLEDLIATREEAMVKERYFIALLTSQDKSIGYNVSSGGDGLNPNDKNTIKKITDSVNDFYKNHHDRAKHSKDRGGFPVSVFKVDGTFIATFATQIDACEQLKLPRSKVCLCLQGKVKQTKGYVIKRAS